MAVDWTLEGVAPWLRQAERESANREQTVAAAMRFGAQQRQQNFENGLRLRELDLHDQAQQLQNKATQLRIDQSQLDLENENHDMGVMRDYLNSINGVTDIDQIRELGAKIPTFKNPMNVTRAMSAASNRLNMLSGTLAQRQQADDIAYNLKRLDALDPDLRQPLRQYTENGLITDAEGYAAFEFAESEQQKRNLERKTEEWRATHTTGLMQEFPAFNPDGTPDTQHVWVPNTTGTGYILRAKIKPEPEIPSRMTVADAQDLKALDAEKKRLTDALPDKAPTEYTAGIKAFGNTTSFKDYQSKTNDIAEIDAKREAIIKRYRPSPATEKKITSQAEFDALQSGSIYIGEDGRKYRKP